MKIKYTSLIILGLLPILSYAQDCPCDDGTSEYTVDCDGDGVNDACSVEDCGPCVAGNEASEGNECCGTTEYDPETDWEFTPYSVDLQALQEAYGAAKNIFESVGPCEQSAGGLPTVSVELGVKDVCCNETLVSKDKYQGTASWNFGSIQCEWPLFGIPIIGSVNGVGNLGANVSFSISGEQTCDETEICSTGTFGVSAGGGASLSAVGDIISFTGTLNVAIEAQAEWCPPEEPTGEVGLQSITLVGEAELVWISQGVSYTVWEG
ncbi:MAG: hypothetical protein H2172_16440 [Opitutus sp.]|nr:hypothetical protein [Opitutus sp.]MCS6274413.1 hypothetical protein [Opitutus sp.]MCS6299775.1 hypothetical protein [Opitutus sp.]